MKNIDEFFQDIAKDEDLRNRFSAEADDAEKADAILKEAGYDVKVEQIRERMQEMSADLTDEQLDSVAGGEDLWETSAERDTSVSSAMSAAVGFGAGCWA